ncbi:hypothetical protein GCM10025868_09020 [Angustibacter aerolatus]|uniref:Clp R domain-containing protein n=1 Tax=Angustibacter aerolatus TaxID=1162965 RepID=A0ABQ6JFG8_9ACTN|nr:Clp protease N-terminal domain-containing protein [Angustibacter aerolatus]GMA85652.1 hypothetical protein GCM10025868_09020 [Angustibacter aerolatus]
MLERFTARARAAVTAAEPLARQEGAASITGRHLLLAVVADPGSGAAQVLAGLGLPPDAVRSVLGPPDAVGPAGLSAADAAALQGLGIDVADVARRFEQQHGTPLGGPSRRPTRRPRLDRTARAALAHAVHTAQQARHGAIGTEHVLLGVLHEQGPDGPLAVRGATEAAARAAVVTGWRRAG